MLCARQGPYSRVVAFVTTVTTVPVDLRPFERSNMAKFKITLEYEIIAESKQDAVNKLVKYETDIIFRKVQELEKIPTVKLSGEKIEQLNDDRADEADS